jgi:hypothetical protein
VTIKVNGRDVSAVALVSELRAGDFAQAAMLGVWLVSDTSSNDAPLQPVAGSDTSLLLTGIQKIIEKDGTFVSCDHGTQLPGVVTHPEEFSSSNSIILKATSTSSDAYEDLVQTVKRSKTIRLSSIEVDEAKHSAETTTLSSSQFTPGLTGPRATLIAALIGLDTDHAEKLIELDTVLPQVDAANKFTVANAVKQFLSDNHLSHLEERALPLVNILWPQEALAKSPR